MNLQKVKVYHLFWITALIILVIGISNPESTLDINIHDTYFIIAHFHVAVVFSLLFFLMGLGYWLVQKVLKKQLVKSLTLIHSLIVIGGFVFYWLLMLYIRLFPEDKHDPFPSDLYRVNVIIASEFLLIICIGIPIYIINLLIGIFRKSK